MLQGQVKIDQKFYEKRFDPISTVVDVLLSPTPLKIQFTQLQQINLFLDNSIRLLATERSGIFNKMLYAYQPIQTHLTETQVNIKELGDAAQTLDDEIKSCKIEPLRRMEHTILYYDTMLQGLQTVMSIQKSIADVEFLTDQLNFREASLELQKICRIMKQDDVREQLMICNIHDDIQNELKDKRKLLRDAIVHNMFDFLFLRRANSMLFEQRLIPIHKLVTTLISNKFEQADIRQEKAVQALQNMLNTVARKTHEQTYNTKKLLKEQEEQHSEIVQTALTSLQNQPNEAITQFNIAYLVLLADCYKKTTEPGLFEDTPEDPVEISFSAYLLKTIDAEMRQLFTRVTSQLADLPHAVKLDKQCPILKDLMKISLKQHFRGQTLLKTLFYFMVSISPAFQVIDTVLNQQTTSEKTEVNMIDSDSCFRQFYNRFLYNFSSVLLVLFDNQDQAIEHATRLGAKMTGQPFARRDSDEKIQKQMTRKNPAKKVNKQQDTPTPLGESERDKKERIRKIEEEQKVGFKDVLEFEMSGGSKQDRPPIFIFNIIQVLCLSPMVQQALKGLMQDVSPEARRYLPPLDIIKQYNNDTLRLIRTNYEMMISAFADRVLNKILPKYSVPIIVIDQHQRNQGHSILGLEMTLDTQIFTFVLRFYQMISVIVFNIPLGFANEDRLYQQERHEDLYECTLQIMKQVIQNLSYQVYNGRQEEIRTLIFNQTHSDENFMFNRKLYNDIKDKEKHFPLLFGSKSTNGGETDVLVFTESDYFNFDPEEKQIILEKLRTRMSVGELVVTLLTLVQELGGHFRECTSLLTAVADSDLQTQYQTLSAQLNTYQAQYLIWIRMELAGRIYSCMRDLSKVDFATGQFSNKRKESLKAEPSLQTMLQEVKQIFNLLQAELVPIHTYWLMTQSYHLSLNLFYKALNNLRVRVVDERGLYRLKQSLQMIKEEFVKLIKQCELKISLNNMTNEIMERNGKMLEKVQYILELLGTKTMDLKEKVREGRDIGLSRKEIEQYMSIQTDAHDATTDEGVLLKLY